MSKAIAVAVARVAMAEGVSQLDAANDAIDSIVEALFWQPEYVPYQKINS